MTGAAVSVCEAAMVTSGSFNLGHSRWAADVKGKPVKPVRRSLTSAASPARGRA
jgi:hypothetical protein